MADLGLIIEIWLANNEWTQARLAKAVGVEETTVQKWKTGKNHPGPDMLKRLSEVMLIDIQDFYEDNYLPVEYERLDDFMPPCMYSADFIEGMKELGYGDSIPEDLIKNPLPRQNTLHAVYDAGLYKDAKLHRFTDDDGKKCSAIYLRGQEVWWHYREHELQMIRAWNDQERIGR